MVFAKTSKAAARLSEQMRSGDFEKKYLAVLSAVPKEPQGKLVNYLKKNAVNNMVYLCPPTTEGAKMASLEYRVAEEKGGCALAEIKLHTGRSHQIRVQMRASLPRLRRHALRAASGQKRGIWRCGRIRSPSRTPSQRSGCASWRNRPRKRPGSIFRSRPSSLCEQKVKRA